MADEEDYKRPEGNLNYKSISCEQIPELFLDKLIAKKHFSKFGRINRFILRPKRLCCTVEYESEQAAELAYEEAGNFNGIEFVINYSELEKGHVHNTEEWVDPDVQSELEAMNPGQRYAANIMRPPPAMPVVMPQPTPPIAKMVAPRLAPPSSAPRAAQKAVVAMADVVPRVDASVRAELETLLRRPAYTDEDKYRVLDARDKLIRLTTVRQTDIKKAVSTKGTCPDMCPEKERLMREFQRQVSCFETSNGDDDDSSTISHRRAIKEYSRSSADQEVPLAHELRSESVLQLTMLYLMHRILDLCDDPQTSLADWFHFVWDRTRSIRKDITQQELCSLGAVQLVEQCARFHIHCAARLVAEDPSVFDKKINAENLTKCLQTLKYMYHDLRIKGVRCPCESEFRSYIVLLNLGDANFLWELKQLPEHIQHSAEIKRAIAFYNALQNNNYVRFFDMMRANETSYLSACILLGYVYRLRLRAMEVIIKSHNWRKNPVFIPLVYLTRVLGFEDEQAAADFFSYHGLQCDEERVMLERMTRPEGEYSMDRALMLVESKRTVSVGECVCGHVLDSPDIFERHQPHNSFEANGLLKAESWNADDQLRGETAAAKAAERKLQQQTNNRTSTTQQIRAHIAQLPPPPTIKTDTNLFKVPMASPPISPKQQQQQKLQQQQQQQQQKTTSIFGGQQFSGGEFKPPAPQTTTAAASSFKFSSDLDDLAPPSQTVFKIPTIASNTRSIDTPSSASPFFGSIFKTHEEKPAPVVSSANIFGGASSVLSSGAANDGNIFGAANIFQQQSAKPPEPLRQDNIFQHFQTQATDFGGQQQTPKSIFAAAAGELKPAATTLEPSKRFDAESKKRADAEKRMRELEAEQAHKQQQLEEERAKLRDLEEKRERTRANEQRQKAIEKLQIRAEKESHTLLQEKLTEDIRTLVANELAQRQALETHCLKLSRELIAEVVQAQIAETATEEYAVMCHDQLLLTRYFERWHAHTCRKLKQRKLMESTPIWATTETRAQQAAQLLHPRQRENLQMIKRYRHGAPCNFKALLWQGADDASAKQLDFFEIITKYSKQSHASAEASGGLLPMRRYFKLILTLPAQHEELPGFESMCNKWLVQHVRVASSKKSDAFICGFEHNLALCVRKISGISPLNESGKRIRSGECDNADAIICFMSSVQLQSTRKRLHHLLKLTRLHKRVPIAFIVYNGGDYNQTELEDYLELNDLLESSQLAEFKFFGLAQQKNQFTFTANLAQALRFVSRSSSRDTANSLDALEMQPLQCWLESQLGEEMWRRWHESSLQNPAFNKICTIPQHVVGIYNEAVCRLQEILTEDLQDSPEFPAELREFVPPLSENMPRGVAHFPLDWKNAARQESIRKFLQNIKLPNLTEQPPCDIEPLELWLLNYASLCMPHDDWRSTAGAREAIKALFNELNRPDFQPYEVETRVSMVSYLPVIKALVFAHVNYVFVQNAQTTLSSELIYRRQALLDYQEKPWWLNYEAIESVTVDYTLGNENEPSETISETSSADWTTILEHAESISRKAEDSIRALEQESLNSSTDKDKLTRVLNESLHQFELAKQIGIYDTSFIDKLDDDFDTAEGAVGGAVYISPLCKRKRKHAETETASEMDDIMAKAFNLINKVESQHDHQLQKRLQLTKGVIDISDFSA